METRFKNYALHNEHKSIIGQVLNLEKGSIGGASIEVETKRDDGQLEFDSYVYNGRLSAEDRDQDFDLLSKLIGK